MKRICIITGASSGMGICFAKQLLKFRQFDEMWLIARRKERLDELASQLSSISKDTSIRCVQGDLSGNSGVEFVKNLSPTTKEGLVVKNKSLKMVEILKNLTLVEKEGYLLNSSIKYAYFEIVFDYINLCKSIC